MAKRQRRSQPITPLGLEAPTLARAPATFAFDAFAVLRALFQEMPWSVPPKPRPDVISTQLNTTVRVGLSEDPLSAEVHMELQVAPDPQFQPYNITVAVVGVFSVAPGGTKEDLTTFAKSNAPVILFPYLRELVSRLTVDARFGPVRLNPMNVRDALAKHSWADTQNLEGVTSPPAIHREQRPSR